MLRLKFDPKLDFQIDSIDDLKEPYLSACGSPAQAGKKSSS